MRCSWSASVAALVERQTHLPVAGPLVGRIEHEQDDHADDQQRRDGEQKREVTREHSSPLRRRLRVEGAFCLFKRSIVDSFHQISMKHSDRYLYEFEFRYNNTEKRAPVPRHDHQIGQRQGAAVRQAHGVTATGNRP